MSDRVAIVVVSYLGGTVARNLLNANQSVRAVVCG